MPRARPRPPIAVVVALALVLSLAVITPAAAASRVPPGFVGMVIGPPVYPNANPDFDLGRQMDTMVASGVESVRFVINWSYAQPYANSSDVPPGQGSQFTNANGVPTRFDQIDQMVGLAAQHRLSVLPVVIYAPSWDAAPRSETTYPQPSSNRPYANFLTTLVQRYGPHGTFWRNHSPKVPIRSWQIWNEPNIPVFWPQQPFARSYVGLLAAAHAAIKHADPGAKVVLAGMPNYSWKALASIYAVTGAQRLFDVVAIHPYTKDPDGVIAIIKKVRKVMDAAGDKRKPILADEISWPSSLHHTTHTEGYDFATTAVGQARNLSTLLPMLGRERKTLGLGGFDYYTWAGDEQAGGGVFDFAGLFRYTLSKLVPKPAFYAFRRAALGLEQCRIKGRVATVCSKRG